MVIKLLGSGSRFDGLQQFGQGEHRRVNLPDAHYATKAIGNSRLPRRRHAQEHHRPVSI